MRLIYLTDRLSDRGGADHHLSQIVAWSVNAGHRVTVAFGRDEGGMVVDDEVELCHVRGLSTLVDSSSRLGELARVLDRADAIHVQNVMNPTALAMAVERGRTVVTVQDHRVFCPGRGKTMDDGSRCTTPMADEVCHHCLPDLEYRRSTLDLTRRRLLALRGAKVVVLSSYMAEELAAAGAPGAMVLPPWVDAGEPRSDPGSCLVLGGRLVPHKGVLDGWRAWKQAGRRLPLLIAGAGPLVTRLDGAEILGWLSPADLRAVLRRARALLFPANWQEPFGILGLEALAQGTPVVVADNGGTTDWSKMGCLRVPPGNSEAMAEAIERLVADPGFAMELGRAGQSYAGEQFSRELIAPRLSELYARVARASATLRGR